MSFNFSEASALFLITTILGVTQAQANDSTSKLHLDFPNVADLDNAAQRTIVKLATELLDTSNFHSSMHPEVFQGGAPALHKRYRTAVAGHYLAVTFEKPHKFRLVRGEGTAIEIIIGLNHDTYADSLFTVDSDSRVVEHWKYSGVKAIELLDAVRSESGEPNEEQAAAIAAIKKLGGWVTFRNNAVLKVGFRNAKVTDADLVHLKGLTSVVNIAVFNSPTMTGAGLVHLKGLDNLKSLYFRGTNVGDAGLEHLKEMTQLRNLYLQQTKVTDAGLVHLKRLTNLRILSLINTEITDAGLEPLKDLTNLQELFLGSTKVTDEGVKKLQQALPNCKIDH